MMNPYDSPPQQTDTIKGRIGQEIHKKVREIQELLAEGKINNTASLGEDNGFVYEFAGVRINCQVTSKKEQPHRVELSPAAAYIGCKMIHAYPQHKFDLEGNGTPGYTVIYEDGYKSWSPKDVFENAYLKIDSSRPTAEQTDMIEEFIHHERFDLGNLPLINCETTTVTGSTFSGGTQATSPDDYQVATDQVREFCHSQVANSIDFVRTWAVNGLKHLKSIRTN